MMLLRMVGEMLFAGEELLRRVRYVSPFDVFTSDGHWPGSGAWVCGGWVLFFFACVLVGLLFGLVFLFGWFLL